MVCKDGGLYKLLIIGGGPAGIGVLVRAARIGFIDRLFNPTSHGEMQDLELSSQLGMKQCGVAIIHDGDDSTFGSGNLGKYVINSNTFARSLLSSVLDEKPDLDPPESIKNTFLERAKDHEITRELESTGNAPACLIDFGRFLRNVGHCLLKDLETHSDTSKCLLNTRATRFERLQSGIYRVEVVENGRGLTLYTEHLVLAMGGRQDLPAPLKNNPAYKEKSFLSEHCLSEDGFTQLRDHLLQAEGRKVCIVGGSHSSFSVAWLLLNTGKTNRKKFLDQSSKPAPGLNYGAEPTTVVASRKHNSSRLPIIPAVIDNDNDHDKFGEVSQGVMPLKGSALAFQPRDITILHRSPIRCYYSTRKDAEADGVDGSRCDRTGCVNTFTGLREDSKQLYKDIKAGKESRVRLFQVNQHGCQSLATKAYELANAIVWCCGYTTRMVPGFDENGNALKFCEQNGVVKLDMQARLQLHLPTKGFTAASNLYGVGLGFSLRSHVDEMGTETRADGVTVYHRRGATLVLAAIFGAEVFGRDAKSFEEMVEKNDKCRKKREHSMNSVESNLVEKVKRPTDQVLPSYPAIAQPISSGTCRNRIAAVVASEAPSPERTCLVVSTRHHGLTRAREFAPRRGAATSTPLSNNCVASSATNPPVRLLLQRRRSAEAVGEPVGRRIEPANGRDVPVKTRSRSGFTPETSVQQGRRIPCAAESS